MKSVLQLLALIFAIHHSGQAESVKFDHHWRMDSERFLHNELKPVGGSIGLNLVSPAWVRNDPAPECVVFPEQGGQLLSSKSIDEILFGANSFSVGIWARISSPRGRITLLDTPGSSGEKPIGLELAALDNTFTVRIDHVDDSVTKIDADAEIPEESWFHISLVVAREQAVLYLNGVRIAATSLPGSAIRFSPDARIGVGSRLAQSRGASEFAVADLRISSESWDSTQVMRSRAERKREIESTDDRYGVTSLKYGPFVEWAEEDLLRLEWETGFHIGETRLTYWPKDEPWKKLSIDISESRDGLEVAWLKDLRKNSIYEFYVSAGAPGSRYERSRRYSFDTALNYSLPRAVSQGDSYRVEGSAAVFEQRILRRVNHNHGFCLIPGISDETLTWELVRGSEMQIVGIQNDEDQRDAIRKGLVDLGIYGARASVVSLIEGEASLGPYFANVIMIDEREGIQGEVYFDDEDLTRMLRPYGGQIVFMRSLDTHDAEAELIALETRFPHLQWENYIESEIITYIGTRGVLEGAGQWTHQYGNASNTSCSGDELVKGELSTLWWGEPGPRPMPDRGPRNPAPLQANGRMYIQGNRTLFGVDAYNGSILWFQTHPELRRANLPRDCSNMVADDFGVYVAEGQYCIAIDGATGARVKRFDVNSHFVGGQNEWGYLSVQNGLVIGSSVRPESAYLGDDGEWYENYEDAQTSRVISLDLFAADLESGENVFVYSNGMILNSTITIDEGVIYFIESRNPSLKSLTIGRAPIADLTEQHLVALDLNSGEILMEEAFDFGGCDYMTYVAHSGDTLVVTGADREKKYHTYAFDTRGISVARADESAVEGRFVAKRLWSESHKEDKGHHSGHLQHPVIIGNVFYSDQRSFDLRTGETLRTDLPERRGCGTMSAAENSLFFRHYFHGMWDLESDERVQFEGIRTGCWLGIIPSGGIVLAPESSAGCSCTHSIQTSMALAPVGLFE